MKITKNDIRNYELAARKYLAEYGVEDGIIFDHFGLQSLTTDEYFDLKNHFIIRGKFLSEITYHDRRLGVFNLSEEDEDKMELIEPHPGEIFLQIDCFVEHIAFTTKNLNELQKFFEDRILSTFNIEEAKGFVIQGPSQLRIEFRSKGLK